MFNPLRNLLCHSKNPNHVWPKCKRFWIIQNKWLIRQTKVKNFRRNKETTYEKLCPGNPNSREQVIHRKSEGDTPGLFNKFFHVLRILYKWCHYYPERLDFYWLEWLQYAQHFPNLSIFLLLILVCDRVKSRNFKNQKIEIWKFNKLEFEILP